MQQASTFPPNSPEERERFLDVIQGSLLVRRHYDLLCWLQGDLQYFLPHEILLAAWGNLALGILYVDVISPIPGVRTEPVIDRDVTPFLQHTYAQWKENAGRSLCLQEPRGFAIGTMAEGCSVSHSFRNMRSAVAHGIKDERGQHDCLYVFFSAREDGRSTAASYMEVLLPHIDTALRQVTHLPVQRKEDSPAEPEEDYGLSEREQEIMKWVRIGKTNQEIGIILDISAFTVKNHLQRIFRKLDVTNRAQAVSKLNTVTPAR